MSRRARIAVAVLDVVALVALVVAIAAGVGLIAVVAGSVAFVAAVVAWAATEPTRSHRGSTRPATDLRPPRIKPRPIEPRPIDAADWFDDPDLTDIHGPPIEGDDT